MTKSGFDIDELERLLAAATPGEWSTCIYDAGDRDHYDHSGPCPSVQAESEDCAIVHWDGFKQEYWSSANGNQRQIEANAALIVALHNSAPAMLTEIRELRAENARLKKLTIPTWFYHPDYPEYCKFDPSEVIDEDYDPLPGDHVFEIDCAVALPSIWCAVHVSNDPDADERFTYTEHASEAEARAALGEPQ